MAQFAAELPLRNECPHGESNDAAFTRRGLCCFFNFTCFESKKSDNWERISRPSGEPEKFNRKNWWRKGIDALKKVKEWSELAAGPKWKTFIRRFNRTGGRARSGKLTKFQYDPSSYSLNFDEGQGQNGDFEGDLRVCLDGSGSGAVQHHAVRSQTAPF